MSLTSYPRLDGEETRRQIVATMQAMSTRGLNRGTAGNVSVRTASGMLVTPTGIEAERLLPEDIVPVSWGGEWPATGLLPSSEWQMHHRLLELRPDAEAVVHCHARHATILACAGRSIPPVHYMVGVSGRASVPLAPYAPFGSRELADIVAATVGGGAACLMANHGLVTLSASLERALSIAEQIEEQAAVYFGTLQIGGPHLLSDDEMADVLERLSRYGQQRP
jgi:L-fuculose-phosphate aldolase